MGVEFSAQANMVSRLKGFSKEATLGMLNADMVPVKMS